MQQNRSCLNVRYQSSRGQQTENDDLPNSCMIYDLHIAPNTPSGNAAMSVFSPTSKLRRTPLTSINASIRFLMPMGSGKKRDASCRVVSLTSSLCVMFLWAFMIRIMHACYAPRQSPHPKWRGPKSLYARPSDNDVPLQHDPASPCAPPRSPRAPR